MTVHFHHFDRSVWPSWTVHFDPRPSTLDVISTMHSKAFVLTALKYFTNYLSYINITFQFIFPFNQNFPISDRTFQFHGGISNLKLSNFSFFQLPFPTTRIPTSFIVKVRVLFNFEILNSDFLTKFWRNYRQSLQRLSTRVCKYFRPESLEESEILL